MKLKVLRFYDGKDYAVSTLPLSKTLAFKKQLKGKRDKKLYREYSEIGKKIENDEASFDELDRYDELADKLEDSIDDILLIVRESLAVKNPQFAFKRGDDAEAKLHNENINNQLKDLIDIDDMNKIMSFTLSGVMPNEESASAGSAEDQG